MPTLLREHLGADLVDRTLEALLPAAATGLAAPAVVRAAHPGDTHRAEAAIDQINRAGAQSKPWAQS